MKHDKKNETFYLGVNVEMTHFISVNYRIDFVDNLFLSIL
jgi:hypothetical protein